MLYYMQSGTKGMVVWRRVGRGSSLVVSNMSVSLPGEGREEGVDWGFHLILVSRTFDLNNGLTERKRKVL